MNDPREMRTLALQMLYQFDARPDEEPAQLAPFIGEEDVDPQQRRRAAELAGRAWEQRHEADALAGELAPDWPTARQPAVDRAIIRLAWAEMALHLTPPRVAINEAIELAKQFSTERSPAFINGMLDQMMRRIALQSQALRSSDGPPMVSPDLPVIRMDRSADRPAEPDQRGMKGDQRSDADPSPSDH